MAKRSFLSGFFSAYLIYASVTGLAMGRTMPALNGLGMIYTGLTWPIAIGCVAADAECSAVPPQRYAKWLFTFEGDE